MTPEETIRRSLGRGTDWCAAQLFRGEACNDVFDVGVEGARDA